MSYKKQALKNRINKPFASDYKTPQNNYKHFGKDEVTGSNPVISSRRPLRQALFRECPSGLFYL